MAHIWAWFCELSGTRGSNGFGPNPIRYPDVVAWASLTQTIIRPMEVRVMMMLDQAYLTEMLAKAAE